MSKGESIEKLVPDCSVIIERLVSKKISKKEISCAKIIIHNALFSWLEHSANENKTKGFLGLDELETLKNSYEVSYSGSPLSMKNVRKAEIQDIDRMILELAFEEGGVLMTSSKVLAKAAKAKGIKTITADVDSVHKKLIIEDFFDAVTMSVHLKERIVPCAKKGSPGNWDFVELSNKKLTTENIQEISREIIEEAGIRNDGFIEVERKGSTIVQLGKFRIVIIKPPFSDGWEITITRPVKHLTIEDYKLSEKLSERIQEKAEGILIAGSPGMGKSTFAQALAEFYASQNKVIKTIEAPRDLVVSDKITQYAISHGDAQEIHDVLLLSRPDYTIFDEMRNTNDFRLFADLRLAGIGLAGVVHATNPVDAIQRFVGRIELGVIPQVIDTVVFIKNGVIDKVLSLNMLVKVPSGMTESDLARPVVVVNDFETKKPEFELYSYGEETVVIPVRDGSKTPSHKLAETSLEAEMKKHCSECVVDVISDNKCIIYVPESEIKEIIGVGGRNISALEKKVGMSLDIKPLCKAKVGDNVEYKTQVTHSAIQILLGAKMRDHDVDIYVGGDYLLTAKAGKTGCLKVSTKNKIGKILLESINMGEKVELFVKK